MRQDLQNQVWLAWRHENPAPDKQAGNCLMELVSPGCPREQDQDQWPEILVKQIFEDNRDKGRYYIIYSQP